MNGCPNCEVLMINGVYCHEHGCPSGYQGKLRDRYENYVDCVGDQDAPVLTFDEWLRA